MTSTGVIHGRFQVLHNDHLKYLMAGKARCDHLVVGITNPDPVLTRDEQVDPNRSSNSSNPLTYFERYRVMLAVLTEAGIPQKDFSVVPLPIGFPDLYRHYVPLEGTFFLTIYDDWGRLKHKRFQELGLKVDVLWERPAQEKGISASEVRRLMTEGDRWEELVPEASRILMKEWKIPERLRQLKYGPAPGR